MTELNYPIAAWDEVEDKIREQWMRENQNTSLNWTDVVSYVKFGWLSAHTEEWKVESIH